MPSRTNRNTPERCEGCAFRPGTQANLQPGTLIKAQLSALICEPFYCHDNLVDGKLPKGQEMLCVGWADMVGALNQRGHYGALPEFKRAILRTGLEMIVRMEDLLLAGEDIEHFDVPSEFLALMDEIARGEAGGAS